MKTTKILLVAIVIGLFSATTVVAQNKTDADSKKEMMNKEMYVCPMHADEKSEKPGKCSQCGMEMKKMNMEMMDMKKGDMMHGKMKHNDMKVDNKREIKMESMSNDMASNYICPMKCEGDKMYDKAGDCPKCGMEMKNVEGKKESKEHKH